VVYEFKRYIKQWITFEGVNCMMHNKSKIKRKRGIELSINFIVTIIIALALFIFGLRFIYNLASEAKELESLTTSELDKKIGSLLCESTDRVCIGIDKKVIPRGEFGVFGMKIINILEDQDFDILISRANPQGYTHNNDPISNTNPSLDFKPESRTVRLNRNDEKEIGIGIGVPRDAVSGTYIFDIRVEPYDSLHKLYVEVP
jgi:hypothetical protein